MKKLPQQRAYDEALSLFKTKLIESDLVRNEGSVLKPIPIQHTKGVLAAWLVPVTVHDRIVGYFQFAINLEFLRYASFQRDSENIEECPKIDDLLNPEKVMQRARTLVSNDEKLLRPYLSYEGDLSRIVWAVEAVKPNGKKRRLFVIGNVAFEERDRRMPFTG